jgi:hypothetical protein
MTGHEELDDSDVPQIAHAESSSREPYLSRSEALQDPGRGDGSVRDGARTATSVSVWDPEDATGSQPAAEPARAARSFCFNCGNRVRPDDLYCLGCGVRLD